MADGTKEIDALYHKWLQAWRSVDINLMVSLFDKDYEALIYQAEEDERPSTNYEQIVAYWKNMQTILERVTEWTEVARTVSVSGECATIFVILNTRLKASFSPKEVAGKLRVSLLVHKTSDRWSIIHYHESRQLLIGQEQGVWRLGTDAKFLD